MQVSQTITFREANAICDVCPKLELHRRNNSMPDMIISTKGNSKVFAHRLILGSRFDKVATRLSGPISTNNTNLNWLSFDHETIESLVRFAYTGVIKVSSQTAYQQFFCAWNLGSDFVLTSISQFMIERVNFNNINLIWTIGDLTNCDTIKQGCASFMAANLDYIMTTNLLPRIDLTTLKGILTNEHKTVSSEEDVIRSIINWTRSIGQPKSRLNRIEQFSDLCNLVDLTKIPLDFIIDFSVQEQDELLRNEFGKLLKKIATLSTHKPSQTKQKLFAIGKPESGDLLAVVKFSSDNPEQSKLVGLMEGDLCSLSAIFRGAIYLIGGNRADLHKRVSTFNVETRETGRVADLQFARNWGHSVVASPNEIFVCGGDDVAENQTCEAFHPSRNHWRRLPDMWQGRDGLAVACLPDGRLVATGGRYDTDILSSCEQLQPGFHPEVWQLVDAMRQARRYHAAIVFDSRVLVVGGVDKHNCQLATCEIFSPPPLGSSTGEMGQWTSLVANMTRAFGMCDENYISGVQSLVAVSASEIIAFGWIDGEVESFKKDSISSTESSEFGAWTWSPLPAIRHLKRICGVQYTN